MIDWTKAESLVARREAHRLSKAARAAQQAMQDTTEAYMEALADGRNATFTKAILDHRKAIREWMKNPVGDLPKRGP